MTLDKYQLYLSELEMAATSLKDFDGLLNSDFLDIGLAYISWADDMWIEYLKETDFISDITPLQTKAAISGQEDDIDDVYDEYRRYVVRFIQFDAPQVEAKYDEYLAEARLYNELHPEIRNED